MGWSDWKHLTHMVLGFYVQLKLMGYEYIIDGKLLIK